MYRLYLLLYCICFIFVKCPWALRKALINKLYCYCRYSHRTSVCCCGMYSEFRVLLVSAGLMPIHGRTLNYSRFGMRGREGCMIWTDHSRICISLQSRPFNCHIQCFEIEEEKMTEKKTCLDRVLRLFRISLSHWALTPVTLSLQSYTHTHTHTVPWWTLAAVCAITLPLLWFFLSHSQNTDPASESLVISMLPIKRLAPWQRRYSICASETKPPTWAAKLTPPSPPLPQVAVFSSCQKQKSSQGIHQFRSVAQRHRPSHPKSDVMSNTSRVTRTRRDQLS